MNPRRVLLEKISDVQRELMSQEFGADYNTIVPVVLDACQKHGLTFYFNFLENSVVLTNAFLLTEHAAEVTNPHTTAEAVNTDEEYDDFIFTSDKPLPPHISKAIEKITAKGIPVTKNSLKNHIPWNEISTEQRIKCTEYLNEMEASK